MKYFFGILTLTFVLTSCSNDNVISSVESAKNDILTFSTTDEFNQTLQKVSSMTPVERKVWENSKGFKSFGTICDDFYKTIEPQNFKTMDDVNSFVAKNSDKIMIYTNDKGDKYCEVQEFDNPARYLMNTDRMYIIGNKAFRTFNEGVVSTDIANIETLKMAKSYSELNSNIISVRTENKQKVSSTTNPVNYSEEYTEGKVNDGWFGASQTYRLVVRFTAEYKNSQGHYMIQVVNYVWHVVLFEVSRVTSYDATMYTTDGHNYSPYFSTPDLITGAYWVQNVTPVEVYHAANSEVRITSYFFNARNDKNCSMDRSVNFN